MKWYETKGNNSDVVLSSSVSLARNLKDYPFPSRLSNEEKKQVNELVKGILLNGDDNLKYVQMNELTSYQAVSLAEKQLISPEFASDSTGRAAIISEDEDVCVMLCEEDHVKIQTVSAGLDLDGAYNNAQVLDDRLDHAVAIAFDEKMGYLTQNPTNLGTGMRASVTVHLPALRAKGAISRLASTVSRLGLSLRALYGVSDNAGDLYRLSNRITLGISEQSAIKNLTSIAEQIVSQERQARKEIIENELVKDKIYRSYGILKSARVLSSAEFNSLISLVRLGVSEGLVEETDLETVNRLMTQMQPATLNADFGVQYGSSQRDILRAEQVRKALG